MEQEKIIKFDSIEMLNQTPTGSLIWNSFLNTLYQTNDLVKAWNAAASVARRTIFFQSMH